MALLHETNVFYKEYLDFEKRNTFILKDFTFDLTYAAKC